MHHISTDCTELIRAGNVLCWERSAAQTAGFWGYHAAQNITGLEINQAPVSQLETRNVVQGHKGELCSGKHISLTLLPFLALPL